MTCKNTERYLETLETWPDRLPPELERHLQHCRRCREAVAAEKALRTGWAELRHIKCPERVTERIFQKTLGKQPDAILQKKTGWWQDWLTALVPRPAFAAWMLMIAFISGAMWLTYRYQPTETSPLPRAEVRQTREDIEYALSILFSTLRKSESVTRDLVFRQKLLNTTKRSLKIAFPNQYNEGEI